MRDRSAGVCDAGANEKFAARVVDESRSFELNGRDVEASRRSPGSKVTAFETWTLAHLKLVVEGIMNLLLECSAYAGNTVICTVTAAWKATKPRAGR